MEAQGLHYLGGWPDEAAMDRILGDLCAKAAIAIEALPDGLRRRDTATHRFYFNYGPEPVTHEGIALAPAGVQWLPLGPGERNAP